jgi:hypothetical protein
MNDRTPPPAGEDPPMDDALRRAAASYHAPPAHPPLDPMWASMEGRVAAALAASAGSAPIPITRRAARKPVVRWAAWGASLAATFVLGFGLGRRQEPSPDALPPVASAARTPSAEPAATTPASPVFQAAASRHFAASAQRLAELEQGVERGRVPADVQAWSRELLVRTRILMDGPAGRDARLRPILRDLEMVLAQTAALGASTAPTEARITSRTIRDTRMVPRLRGAAAGSGGRT